MIRPLEAKDIPRLKEMHKATGFEWPFPEFGPEFLSAQVVVDENDSPVMMIAARKLAEVMLIADPKWETPGIRKVAFNAVYEAVEEDLRAVGVKEATAWIQPSVWKSFGRRLAREFGWVENKQNSMQGFVRSKG